MRMVRMRTVQMSYPLPCSCLTMGRAIGRAVEQLMRTGQVIACPALMRVRR